MNYTCSTGGTVLPQKEEKEMVGYTHQIEWYGFDALLGFDVRHSFRTTTDAVDLHVKALQAKGYSVIVTVL